jgi:hypothetical protein
MKTIRNYLNLYQERQNEKKNNDGIIKQEFKNSIANWKLRNKLNKLTRSLQNRE